MYHSITFGDGTVTNGVFVGTNTWDDWHLIPSSRPVVASPGVSTNFVEIPGQDGALDISTYLTGDIAYGTRSGSFEFYVDNDHEYWENLRRKIINTIHGQKMKMCLEDDPGYYWEGRFSLNEWRSEPWNSKVVIDYVVGPYKIANVLSGSKKTVWDTFNFDTDIDWYVVLHDVVLTGNTYTVTIPAYRYEFPITAQLTSDSGSVTVAFGGVTATLTPSSNKATLGTASYGNNTLTATGTGTVTFSFREGSL